MSSALTIRNGGQAGELIQLVAFTVANEEFAVEVASVREIIRVPVITALPNSPSCVEGIVSLRGGVIPIISLRERFALQPIEDGSLTRIMVMTVGERVVGFKVDAVNEVIRVASLELQPAPPLVAGAGERRCLAGVIEREGRLLVVLEAERMLLGADLGLEPQAA